MSPVDDASRAGATGPADTPSHRPRPGPSAGSDAAARRGRSRRWFLAGGTAALVGGGAGVGAGFLRPVRGPAKRPAPAALLAAAAAERELLATVVAAVGSDPSLRTIAAALTRDHTAHLQALQSSLAAYDPQPAAQEARSGTAPGETGSARARLAAAERAAGAAAAARAERLDGPTATLLASIAACENTHVELLR